MAGSLGRSVMSAKAISRSSLRGIPVQPNKFQTGALAVDTSCYPFSLADPMKISFVESHISRLMYSTDHKDT